MWAYFLKIFFRNFSKQKAYTIINVFGLSTGIAVVMVIFSWIHFHLNFESYFDNSNNIYRVIQKLWNEEDSELVAPTPGPLAQVLINDIPEIQQATKVHYGPDLIIKANNDSFVEQKVLFVDSSFLHVFNCSFIKGANLTTTNNWIILTETIAKKYFGKEDPIGKELIISGNHNVSIVGVIQDLPRDTHLDFNVLLPLPIAISLGAEIFPEKWYRFAEVVTYIKTYPSTNQSELGSAIRFIKAKYSEDKRDELILQPVRDIHLQTEINYNMPDSISRSTLVTFGIIATLVLVIACLNYIILSTGISSIRIKSAGIQKIHGASKYQIMMEMLIESLLLTIIAFIVGIILIELFISSINQFLNFELSFKNLRNSPVFIMFLLSIIILGIINGLYPATILAGTNPLNIFGKQSNKHISRKNILKSLIIIQFTGGLLLLIFSGIVHNQIKYMLSKNPGFDSNRLLAITLYDQTIENLYNNFNQITHDINALEGVENNTFSYSSPAIIGTSAGEADWEGKREGQHVNVKWNSVFFNYFETIGTPIIEGRDFSDANENDIIQDNRSTFILNETAVSAMGFSNEEVINREFTLYDKTGPIIGVVKDFHFKPLYENVQPMAFFIHPYYLRSFLIRGKSEFTQELVAEIKMIWNKYLPDDPFDYDYVHNTYQDIYSAETRLFNYNSFMALLIVLISSLGFSGLAFLIIDSKSKEIGIRKIHGASSLNIMKHLLLMFLKWILIASCIAIPTGFYLSFKWLEKFAFKTDITFNIFVIPIGFICSIAFISIAYRVFQSSIKKPVDIIRYE